MLALGSAAPSALPSTAGCPFQGRPGKRGPEELCSVAAEGVEFSCWKVAVGMVDPTCNCFNELRRGKEGEVLVQTQSRVGSEAPMA